MKYLVVLLSFLVLTSCSQTEIPRAAPTAIGSPGSPDGVAISPEGAAWLKRAKIHVRKNWVVPPGFRTQALEAHVEVDLDASGGVRAVRRGCLAARAIPGTTKG